MPQFFHASARHRPDDAKALDSSSNVALWVAFTVVLLGSDGYFLVALHRHWGWDAVLALAALAVRVALLVALGLFVEALLLRTGDGYLTVSKARRSVLHAFWIAIMLVSVLLVADVLVFAFAGYHIPTAIRILLCDGPLGVVKVVDATGLSPKMVVTSGAGLGLGLAAAIGLSKLSRRFSNRFGIVVTRHRAVAAIFISLGILALVETASYSLRDPFRWEREIREVPLAFAIVRPNAELASFRVSVQRRLPKPRASAAAAPPRVAQRPDIFIVIIESLRADMVEPQVMPHFSKFAGQAWRYRHAVTTGNVTHYSWYGLLCGRLPLYFDVVKHNPAEHRSPALAALRDAGYRIHLLATPDTGYQNLESIVFGPGRPGTPGSMLTDKFHPEDPDVARRDELVVGELVSRLGSHPPGGSMTIVALDSPHFGYQWGRSFRPPFVPYATNISIVRDYEHSESARRAVINRYKNSVAWVDSLLGKFFEALDRTGRTNNSIVVVTGDHGEAFWEHGSATHGSDLGREQLEVGFAMKLPGAAPRSTTTGLFSLLDVMPTILDQVGVRGLESDGKAEQWPSTPAAGIGSQRAAFAFQGWNERAYRFALMMGGRRLLFELDAVDPLKARHLVLKEATDLSSGTSIGGESSGPSAQYADVIRDLPQALVAMDFLTLEGP